MVFMKVILSRSTWGHHLPYPLPLIVKVKAIRVQQILVLSSVANFHAKECFDTSFGDDLRKSGWMYW